MITKPSISSRRRLPKSGRGGVFSAKMAISPTINSLFSLECGILARSQKVEGELEHKIINCPHCGKIISKDILNADNIRPKVTCPDCGSQRNCKDGKRQTRLGKVQCYLCRDCGYRFS